MKQKSPDIIAAPEDVGFGAEAGRAAPASRLSPKSRRLLADGSCPFLVGAEGWAWEQNQRFRAAFQNSPSAMVTIMESNVNGYSTFQNPMLDWLALRKNCLKHHCLWPSVSLTLCVSHTSLSWGKDRSQAFGRLAQLTWVRLAAGLERGAEEERSLPNKRPASLALSAGTTGSGLMGR